MDEAKEPDWVSDCGTVTLYRGDCLSVLPWLEPGCIDAVATDPPYSSGGFTRSDRTMSVSAKYVQTGSERCRSADFAGDNRDQRSWAYWCHLWMAATLRVAASGAYGLFFADWRQLPTLTDAIQAAGWVWRGLVSWDKGEAARAPFPHYFRHQCEYVAWGSVGPLAKFDGWPLPGQGCYPGSYSFPVIQSDKHHVTGKPTALMRQLVQVVPPGRTVFDPFMGSGTTGVACVETGRRFVGIEIDPVHFETARVRLEKALREQRGMIWTPPPAVPVTPTLLDLIPQEES